MKVKWLTGFLPVLLILCMCFAACETEVEKVVYRDPIIPGFAPAVLEKGPYIGKGEGLHGTILLDVVFTENMIESVSYRGYEGTAENGSVGIPAIRMVAQKILELQTTNVDVIAGATYSSLGTMAAVRDAIDQAGGTDQMLAWNGRTKPITIMGEPDKFNPDVIVVGGGLGGVYAAMRIADLGGKALLIEQAPHLGGSSRFVAGSYTGAGGVLEEGGARLASNISETNPYYTWSGSTSTALPLATIARYTAWLKAENYDTDPPRPGYFANAAGTGNWIGGYGDAEGKTNFQFNPVPGFNVAVSAAYVDSTARSTDKLLEWGMLVRSVGYLCRDPSEAYGTGTAWTFTAQGNSLFANIEPKMNRFINAGLMGYILNSKVVDIIVESGKCVGVVVEGGKRYRAGAVIMASGGYVHNYELMARPVKPFDPVTGESPKDSGPGITYFTSSCSDTDIGNMTQVLIDTRNVKSYRMDQTRFDSGVLPMIRRGAHYSNAESFTGYANNRMFLVGDGVRHGNESLNVDGDSHSRIQFEMWDLYRTAPENQVYVIGTGTPTAAITRFLNDPELKQYAWRNNTTTFTSSSDIADAIWDLCDQANQTGKPPFVNAAHFVEATVRATATAYDAECDEAALDPTFVGTYGKPATGLGKLTPPLWMVRTAGHVKGTLGGIVLNTKAEVIDREDNKIPGLYGCGEIGGNIAQSGYTWVVGLNMSHEAGYGDIAAVEALKYSRGE